MCDAPYPVREETKNPRTMITFVSDEAVLRRAAGAFSVTYSGGVAVLSPMLMPRRSFATNRTGRSGAKTSACVESVEFFDGEVVFAYERRCQTEYDCSVKQSLASQHVGKLACSIASEDLTYRASSVPCLLLVPMFVPALDLTYHNDCHRAGMTN